MGVIIEKDCVPTEDGTLWCWDGEKDIGYAIKKVTVGEMPLDAVAKLLSLKHKDSGAKIGVR